MRPSGLFYLSIVTCFLFSKISSAQDETKSDIDMASFQLKVVDPHGEPIEGVEVQGNSLMTPLNRGRYRWSADPYPEAQFSSDSNGIIEVQYPVAIEVGLPVSEVNLTFKYSRFVELKTDCDVDEELRVIQLKTGHRIVATAIDHESREQVKQDVFAFLSEVPVTKWTNKNGFLESPVFAETQTALRLVHAPRDGPLKFTDLMTAQIVEGQSRIMMKDCELHVGVRVEGRLHDDVPRPVQNGVVNAFIAQRPDTDDRRGRLFWLERAKVNEDGTFIFESLPRNSVLQMVAICDGWVPVLPMDSEIYFGKLGETNDVDSFPQLVRLEAGKTARPELKMLAANQLKVTVLGPDGLPIPNVRVVLGPNQRIFDMGAMQLGGGSSYTRWVASLRDETEIVWDIDSRFDGLTDEHGKVNFLSIPNFERGIFCLHESYELPSDDPGLLQIAEMKAGQVLDVTLRLRAKIKKNPK